MDRSRWMSTQKSPSPDLRQTNRLPPWEQQSIPQVMLTKPALQTSALSSEEKVMRWTGRTSSESVVTDIESSSDTEGPPHGQSHQSEGSYYHQDSMTYGGSRRNVPMPPLTPPRSLSNSSKVMPSAEIPRSPPAIDRPFTPPTEKRTVPKRPVIAMPGTMSSRPTTSNSPLRSSPQRSRRRAPSTDEGSTHPYDRKDKQPTPFGSRVKSAFKDMFHRNQVDPTSFEKIEDKHWSDDW